MRLKEGIIYLMQWQAITVSDLLKIDNEIIRESLITFSGLPHRLENFLKIKGVNYINDSKATNVNAAYYALDSMKSPTVLDCRWS